MPNVNFKFDADASKVERAIKRLGTEFEKVVNTGDNIDKTLIDFGALVDKNADKVQNLKNEMQKLNAVNLQNMATQFERINAGGFNELIQGLRNVQTGVIGTENSVENLITKLGLSKNSLQQVSVQMRQALGNMSLGSEEYKATLNQINLLEQAMSRIDQNVTAGAGNTFAANQAKIASTQGYASVLQQSVAQIQQSNATILSNTLNTVHTAGGYLEEFKISMINSFSELKNFTTNLSNFNDMPEIQRVLDKMQNPQGDAHWSDALNKAANDVNSPAFVEYIKIKIQAFMSELDKGKMSFEEFISNIVNFRVSGVASLDTIKEAVDSFQGFTNDHSLGLKINKYFDENELNKSASNIMDFAMKVGDASELTQKTLAELKGKSELEIQAISNALQRLKNELPIDSQAYKAATTQIGIINMEMQKTARANQAMSGGTSSASMAIQQLGFAVGDAGQLMNNFRGAVSGISNNMPFVIQYIMEMNQTAKAAGTTGLKAFGAALTGPAGILLGINAVMFAMQVLPDVFTKIAGSAAVTTKAIRSNVVVLKELAVAMRASSVMGDESTRSTLAEGVAFKELSTRLQSTTANSKERKIIVDQIQAAYPEYIKNIDLNKASEKDLTLWVKNSTAALYGKIKAMLLDKLIEKNSEVFVEATQAYQKAIEDNEAVKKQKGKNNEPDKDTQSPMYDDQGNFMGYASTKSTKQRASDDVAKTKKDLDKATDGFKIGLTRATLVVETVMSRLGLDPGLANTDPDALKDYNKELKGDKGKKEDEYTALEQLADKWDKIIAKEIDASKIAGLKFQKALEIWDLSQKTLKEQEQLNKAEISYLNSVREFADYMEGLRKEKVEKLFDKASKAYEDEVKLQKLQDETDEAYIKRRVDSDQQLSNLKDRNNSYGLSESDQIEYDLKKELSAVELDEFGLKEERKFQIQEYFANKRIQVEESTWERNMSIISNALGAFSSMFTQYTDEYKTFAIAQATIDMWVGANAAFRELPFPLDWVQFSAVLAQGYASIDEITKVSAYAKGGIVNQPTLGLVGEAGAEIIAPVRDFQSYSRELVKSANAGFAGGGGELTATVKGTDLVFVLQKAEKKVNRQKVGGSL